MSRSYECCNCEKEFQEPPGEVFKCQNGEEILLCEECSEQAHAEPSPEERTERKGDHLYHKAVDDELTERKGFV